jgi:beta-xylosidase
MQTRRLSVLVLMLLAGLTRPLSPQTVSPKSFKPGEVWLDGQGQPINAHAGGVLFHAGVYYWFGQHMVEGARGNAAWVGVHVYSSRDLLSWKDEGIALTVKDDPRSDIAAGCILERPKVIYNARTRVFVMWFHLELKGQGYKSARSGVAVADRPTGPYRFIASFRPNAGVWPDNVEARQKEPVDPALYERDFGGGFQEDFGRWNILGRDQAGGQMARDMTLFVDDDGRAYQVYASEENGALHLSLLTDDYLKPAGRFVRLLAGRFREAPALFKHQRKYYLLTSGCTGWRPNAAGLAVADRVWGPWKEIGNPCRGTSEEEATTFESQGTFILPVQGQPGAFIFMADRWRPENAVDGRYIWLPLQWEGASPVLKWLPEWDLTFFKR